MAMTGLIEKAVLITTTSTPGLVAIRIALEVTIRVVAVMREDMKPRATIEELQGPTTKIKTGGESKREAFSNNRKAARKAVL